MRTYELILVLKTLTEKNRKALVETVKKLLGNVKFSKEEEMGSKALKYKIKGEQLGVYYDFVFETDKIEAGFEKKLINTNDILRHLVIRTK